MIDLMSYGAFFLTVALTYAIITLGLNVQWGQTGLFNVGIAGFVAVGAYVSALLTTPDLIPQFETQIEDMACADPDHGLIRSCLLQHVGATPDEVQQAASAALGTDALEKLCRPRHVAITPCLRNPGDRDLVRLTIAEELAKLEALRGLNAEIAEASEDLSGVADETLTWRLKQAAKARQTAQRAQSEDRTEYDLGPNGAAISREERSAFAALMETIRFDKPRR